MPGDHRKNVPESGGVRQLQFLHPGAGREVPGGERLPDRAGEVRGYVSA